MASLVLDTSNCYCEPQTQPILTSTPFQNGNKKKIKNCQCCPYGYHIDLDFIRYCEQLTANSKPPSNEQIIRRNKRRQRKSKEFMLGVDIPFSQQFYQYQIQQNFSPIVFQLSADDSSRILNSVNYNNTIHDIDSIDYNEENLIRKRASSMPVMSMKENSAFVKDILFDVCSDFERTLERSLSKSKPKKYAKARPYVLQASDISPQIISNQIINQHSSQKNRIVHIEKIESKVYNRNETKIIDLGNVTINIGNGVANVTTNNGTAKGRAEKIDDRVDDYERSQIHFLKKQVESLPKLEPKIEDQAERNMKLKELEMIFSKQNNHESVEQKSIQNSMNRTKHTTEEFYVTRNSSPFSPQRVCAMSLDSLKLRASPKFLDGLANSSVNNECILSSAKSTPIQANVHSQRDVGCMAHTPLSRSIGTLTTPTVPKELKTASTNTVVIHEKIITIQQGQQTDQRLYTQEELQIEIAKSLERYQKQQQRSRQLNSCTVGTQSDLESKKQHSISTMTDSVGIPSHSVSIMAKPDVCDRQCMTVANLKSTGTNTDDSILPARPSKSVEELSAFKEDLEHPISLKSLDKFKCTSIQCVLLTDEPKEKIVSTHTIGVQHSPRVTTKSVQCTEKKVGPRSQSESTDTRDLVLLINRSINTDTKPQTCDRLTNTDSIAKKTTDVGVNCDPPQEKVEIKEVKTTENINDTGNTCIAKVEIKQRTVISGMNRHDEEQQVDPQTRIPRPMALISPRPDRKFNRQNTYTISPASGRAHTNETTSNTTTLVSHRLTDVESRHQVNAESVAARRNEETSTSSIRCPAEEYLERVGSMSAHSSPKPIHKSISASVPSSSTVSASPSRSPQEVNKHIVAVESETQNQSSADNTRQAALWATTSSTISNVPQTSSSSSAIRQKAKPSKEMLAALKVINDSLQKCQQLPTNLKNANKIVQKEWFHISSTESANPLDVEDYLDCFEEFSQGLLKYVVNLSDSNGNTAMHYAVSHGNFDVVSILLDSKVCCVNQTNNAGYTCVMLVSLAKLVNPEHQTVVQRLFHLADVNIRAKKHNQTSLMLAVSHGNYDMVHMLLEAGAEINIQDEDGSTALMCAAEHGRIDIIKLLLAHPDCDSTIQDVDGSTALKISLEAGFRDIGVLLYAHEHMSRNRSPQSSIRRSGIHSSSLSSSTTNIGGNDTAEGNANNSGSGATKRMPS